MREKTKIYAHGEGKAFGFDFKGWALEATGDLNVKLCRMTVRRRENVVQGVLDNKREKNKTEGWQPKNRTW
jgi:hypothetical protein